VSIGWGVWDRVGMTARIDDAARARMSRRGVDAHSAAEGVEALDAALRQPAAHVLAIRIDAASVEDRSVLREIRTAPAAPVADDLLRQWTALADGMRRPAIAQFVGDQARKVLGLPVGSVIPPRQPFNELGLDSLMAVELRNVIGAALGEAQQATLLFDHPTSEALVDYLLAAAERAGARSAPPPTAEAPTISAADVEMVAELSEAEAEAMLLAELSATDHDT
jgi:hypothetical protein